MDKLPEKFKFLKNNSAHKPTIYSVKKLLQHYQYMLGDIYYWSYVDKALLIVGVTFFMNLLFMASLIISHLVGIDEFRLDFENIKPGIYILLFNMGLLGFSALILLFFLRKKIDKKISLVIAMVSLVLSMVLTINYLGLFNNMTWQVLFLFNVSLMMFVSRATVILSFVSLICLILFLNVYSEYLPFSIYAIGFSYQLPVENIHTYGVFFQWVQLFWIAGIGSLLLNFFLSLWRIRYVDLRFKSYIDELTKLLNRRAVLEGLNLEYKRAKRIGYPISIAIIDLDFFKRVNDEYGHPFGDVVLQGIAKEFQSLVRKNDLVGRYGGEEFLIVLPECDAKTAEEVVENLRHKIEQLVFDTQQGHNANITISAGIAQYEEVDKDYLQVIARADYALYRAKQLGRNRVISIECQDDDEILAFLDTL